MEVAAIGEVADLISFLTHTCNAREEGSPWCSGSWSQEHSSLSLAQVSGSTTNTGAVPVTLMLWMLSGLNAQEPRITVTTVGGRNQADSGLLLG
jgi:hypothetical protein